MKSMLLLVFIAFMFNFLFAETVGQIEFSGMEGPLQITGPNGWAYMGSTPATVNLSDGIGEYTIDDAMGNWTVSPYAGYATNVASGSSTGSFTISTTPTVSTTDISSITHNSASSGGNVTSDGLGGVSSRGVCWDTSTAPTTANSKTTDGSGTGSYSSNLTGLSPSTTYYVRAYASNNAGTSYGTEKSFITNDDPLPVTLTSFEACYSMNNVILNWTTQSETDNLGWNIFRSKSENGYINNDFIQINSILIDGMGTATLPTDYFFADEYPNVEGHTYWYWLQSVSTTNEFELFGPISIEIPIAGQLPSMTILSSNYPNPFNPETIIEFEINESETGILTIYNIRGEKILIESFDTGIHHYHWNADGLASGIYFYKLSSPTINITKKMILMK